MRPALHARVRILAAYVEEIAADDDVTSYGAAAAGDWVRTEVFAIVREASSESFAAGLAAPAASVDITPQL